MKCDDAIPGLPSVVSPKTCFDMRITMQKTSKFLSLIAFSVFMSLATMGGIAHAQGESSDSQEVEVPQELGPEAMQALVKQAKGSVQAPKSVDFVAAIPLTPVGKPDKKMLRAQYWKDSERQVG